VPIRALQEWMGHSDLQTTQIYAKYAPADRDAELIARAFARGSVRGTDLAEPTVTQEQPSPANAG
jgi:hypothetical protein